LEEKDGQEAHIKQLVCMERLRCPAAGEHDVRGARAALFHGNYERPMKSIRHIIVGLGLLLGPGVAGAATVQINASKDNTLYQPASGGTTNSNGLGEHLFAGRTDDEFHPP
jgi:hypothetical protein